MKNKNSGLDLVESTDDIKEKIKILESLLAEKKDELSELSLQVQNTKISLNIFLGKYNSTVGRLYIKLDKIVLEVKKYKLRIKLAKGKKISQDDLNNIEEEAEETFAEESQKINDLEEEASESTAEYDKNLEQEDKRASLDSEDQEELKRLYRKLALKYHPDMAKNDKQRKEFHNLMTIINAAYKEGDLETLRKYMKQAEREEKIAKETKKEKLKRLKEEYDTILGILAKLYLELEDIKNSETYKLKVKVDKAKKEGRDLLKELADDIKEEIKEKQHELAELVMEYKEILNEVQFQNGL
jgi:hypothetical protein